MMNDLTRYNYHGGKNIFTGHFLVWFVLYNSSIIVNIPEPHLILCLRFTLYLFTCVFKATEYMQTGSDVKNHAEFVLQLWH